MLGTLREQSPWHSDNTAERFAFSGDDWTDALRRCNYEKADALKKNVELMREPVFED